MKYRKVTHQKCEEMLPIRSATWQDKLQIKGLNSYSGQNEQLMNCQLTAKSQHDEYYNLYCMGIWDLNPHTKGLLARL
jgi:hypothetical protein